MTKKLLLSLAAIIMIFATSCSSEQDLALTTGKTSVVSFNITTPELVTRAFSDGTTATVLQYAVYNAAGEELTDLTVTDGVIHGSTTIDLHLTTGNSYAIIFWAAAPGAPYKVDFATQQLTVDYAAAVCNDENRDAFYKYHTFTVTGAQTETIELKRPFAQLNIGTADYAASKSAGYVPTMSAVTVKNIYNTLNLATGAVDGPAEVTFDYNAIPTTEAFPINGYEYLSMNYLLVPVEKGLVEIVFGHTDADATTAKTRTVGSVPVQRNYRTNLYGSLLTSLVEFDVTINPNYEDQDWEVYLD